MSIMIAMRATKLRLNAQVQPELQDEPPGHLSTSERGTATSDQRRQLDLEYQDWAYRTRQ